MSTGGPQINQPKFLVLDRRAQLIAGAAIGSDPDAMLDTCQVADWLCVSVQWLEISRSKNSKYGPPFKRLSPKTIRYRVGDVLAWLETRTQAAEKKLKGVA